MDGLPLNIPSFTHPHPLILHPADDLLQQRPDLHHAAVQLAHAYATSADVTDDHLQAIGAALWSSLPAETVAALDAALATAGANILPLVLQSGSAAVQALPWETLYHPAHQFLARSPRFAFSRRYAAPPAEAASPRPAPLKVLHFTMLPDDVNLETARLNVEREQERVQIALLPFVMQGSVQLQTPDDGRLETLKHLLTHFQPHILFLSGHGKFAHEPGSGRAPYGVLQFEDEAGGSRFVPEQELAEALVGKGVQMVVLSACESGKAASDALNNGLARHLAALGIPHVIGMRESVLDEAGIAFAESLCYALANGERADVAVQAARAAMRTLTGGLERRESGLPPRTERLRAQWTLPMLISPRPDHPLASSPLPMGEGLGVRAGAGGEGLPPLPMGEGLGVRGEGLGVRFIGRRAELRKTKHRLLTGKLTHLLITGAGGHGKTTLARKLARDLQAHGYRVFEWRTDTAWRDFQSDLAFALSGDRAQQYDRAAVRFAEQPAKLAQHGLNLLNEQYHGKLLLLFDNLESIQDPTTHQLTDAHAAAWLHAACAQRSMIVLATSRWLLPDWHGEHLPLTGMTLGDFLTLALTLAERGQLNPHLLHDRAARLLHAYTVLGHNPRGLEWFASATLTMSVHEQDAFAAQLANTQAELRLNMALEETVRRLPPAARTLLCRLHVYAASVPEEGITKLGLDLPDPAAALNALLTFSLLEVHPNHEYSVLEYQTEPSLLAYLSENNLLQDDPALRSAAADFLLWLTQHERNTYTHLTLVIEALHRAERHPEADHLTLDKLVGRYTLDGRYAELLTRWLPQVCQSAEPKTRAEALDETGKLHLHLGRFTQALPYFEQSMAIRQQIGDKAGEGTTLNNISQIYDAQGDYAAALTYLQQSLAIRQQIGDKAGLCATLFNIGHIHWQNDEMQEAASAWVTVYAIAKQINHYQVLQALSQLAPRLGLPPGLEGWEMLSARLRQSSS